MANNGLLGIPGSELFVIPPAESGGFFIAMWSGPTTAVPAGWQLCDGSGGTPDLRDRFVVGAGSTYTPGDTGGATTNTPSFTGDPMTTHTHTLSTGEVVNRSVAGSDLLWYNTVDAASAGTPVGTISEVPTLPPYYALCLIAYVGGGSV